MSKDSQTQAYSHSDSETNENRLRQYVIHSLLCSAAAAAMRVLNSERVLHILQICGSGMHHY